MRLKLFLSFFFSISFLFCHAQDIAHSTHEALLEKWISGGQYTLDCMEAMPAELYDFSPVPDEMNFKELSIHIIQNMVWLSSDYLNGGDFTNPTKDIDPSKEQLIELMSKALAFSEHSIKGTLPHEWQTKVDFFAGEMPIIKILHLMGDHMTHHRAQLAVYLRMNSIKPPRYVGW